MKKIYILVLFAFTSAVTYSQNYQWAKSIGSFGDDCSYQIAVDHYGNCYIAGTTNVTADFDPGADTSDLPGGGFFAKYDTYGNFIWAKSISGSGNIVQGMALDNTGNCYISGYFTGTVDFDFGSDTANLISDSGGDIFIAKYDANGNYLWAGCLRSADPERTAAIAIDGTGNCYITGMNGGTIDCDPGPGIAYLMVSGSMDIFFAKYDANGNYLWAKGIGAGYWSWGNDIAVDSAGNCFITGLFEETADFDPGPGTANLTAVGAFDIFFAKYDASGNYLWAKNVGCHTDDWGNSISVDNNGNCLVTGKFGETADFDPGPGTANLTAVGYRDIFFAKYDSSGNYIWAKSAGGTNYDEGYCITFGDSGSCYVTGYFNFTADFDPGAGTANLTAASGYYDDIFFAKYDANGNYLWAKSLGSTDDDKSYGIAVDGTGNCYLTGSFNQIVDFDPNAGIANLTSVGGSDIFFAKYGLTNGVNEYSDDDNFIIYPNPATDNLTIGTSSKATIEIYNIEGQIIKRINAIDEATAIDISELSRGMYFVKAKMEKGIVVKKFVKE